MNLAFIDLVSDFKSFLQLREHLREFILRLLGKRKYEKKNK